MAKEEEDTEIPKINVHDQNAVKRTLDEQVVELLKEDDVEELFFWSNIKVSCQYISLAHRYACCEKLMSNG